MEECRGDLAMAVKKWRRWHSVRAMLKHGERGRRAEGGRWTMVGFFTFYSGRGGEGRQPVVKVVELSMLMGMKWLAL
jgi:hypothetical protein